MILAGLTATVGESGSVDDGGRGLGETRADDRKCDASL